MAGLQSIQTPGNRYMTPNSGETGEHGENYGDLLTKLSAMFTELYGRTGGSSGLAASGLIAQQLPLTDAMTAAGVFLTASAGAGVFGVSLTPGTSVALASEAASANTKTDTAVFEYVLPGNYIAGQNVTVTVNTNSAGAGTPTTQTVQAKAFKVADDGTQGADLIGASAATITSSKAAYTFTIPGTGLVAGTHLMIEVIAVIANASSSNTINVNSVKVS